MYFIFGFTGFAEMLDGLDPVSIFSSILLQASEDKAMGLIPHSKGWLTQQMARDMAAHQWAESPLQEITKIIVEKVAECMYKVHSNTSFSHKKELDALGTLMAYTVDAELLVKWISVVKPLAPGFAEVIYDNLLQHIFDELTLLIGQKFKQALKAPSLPVPGDSGSNIEVTADEKCVLHYAIGFVARKLMKKYLRTKSNKASQLFLQIVQKWTEPVDSSHEGEAMLSEEVTAWTAAQDRGSLIHCSPKFFHFMKLVELKTREKVNSKTISSFAGKNIIPIVAGYVKGCPQVQDNFKTLVGFDILNEFLSEALLDDLVMTWTAMKARQASKKFIFDLRTSKEEQVSRMGTPALRKTLDKH